MVDAELQRGGQVRQGFDVVKMPLTLGSIDFVLGLVVVLTRIGLQTQWLHGDTESSWPCDVTFLSFSKQSL